MAMHLLVETAIVDSNEYEILSYEEVDELKKEYTFLANRIDASKRKLALESKVRDAALSLSRLYSKKGRQRRSLLGGVSDVTKHTDEELMASNRKCEELSQELWRLNNRAVEIQRRLLQHAAGILGMTHHGGIKSLPRSPLVPGSSSSSYTLVNRRGTMSSLNAEFDDRSFYRTPDKLDEFDQYDQERPVERASNRFQRPENGTPTRSPGGRLGSTPNDDTYTTRRLEDLNNQLQGLLQMTNIQALPPPPPHPPVNGTANGVSVQDQISLLEQGVNFIQQNQLLTSPANPRSAQAVNELEKTEVILSSLWDMLILGEEEVRNQRMDRTQRGLEEDEYPDSEEGEIDYDEDREFSISAFSAKVQALYTRATHLRSERTMLRLKVSQHQRHFENETEAINEQHREKVDNLNAELSSLSSQLEQFANIVHQREDDIMAATGRLNNLMNELDATRMEAQQKRDEARTAREELTTVMEQLDIARRKDQQRTMEDNAGRGKEAMALEAERRARAEAEGGFIAQIREKEEQLMDLQNECDEIKEDRDIAKAELDVVVSETEERLKKLEEEIAALKDGRQVMEEAKNRSSEQEGLLRAELEAKDQQVKKMDEEMRELEGKVAELSTEVALLKAELDSAYGSRQQRAAETAEARAAAAALEAAGKRPQVVDPGLLQEVEALAMKNHQLMEEIAQIKAEKSSPDSNLEKRCKLLQSELDGMLVDFENLTTQSIGFENERIKLEELVDGLRARCEGLETSLADERVRWLGVRTSGDGRLSARQPGDISGESTSISVLRSEFRKITRDMRAEQTKALKVFLFFSPSLNPAIERCDINGTTQAEQEERRKLEGIVRSLRKEQLQRKGHTSVSSN